MFKDTHAKFATPTTDQQKPADFQSDKQIATALDKLQHGQQDADLTKLVQSTQRNIRVVQSGFLPVDTKNEDEEQQRADRVLSAILAHNKQIQDHIPHTPSTTSDSAESAAVENEKTMTEASQQTKFHEMEKEDKALPLTFTNHNNSSRRFKLDDDGDVTGWESRLAKSSESADAGSSHFFKIMKSWFGTGAHNKAEDNVNIVPTTKKFDDHDDVPLNNNNHFLFNLNSHNPNGTQQHYVGFKLTDDPSSGVLLQKIQLDHLQAAEGVKGGDVHVLAKKAGTQDGDWLEIGTIKNGTKLNNTIDFNRIDTEVTDVVLISNRHFDVDGVRFFEDGGMKAEVVTVHNDDDEKNVDDIHLDEAYKTFRLEPVVNLEKEILEKQAEKIEHSSDRLDEMTHKLEHLKTKLDMKEMEKAIAVKDASSSMPMLLNGAAVFSVNADGDVERIKEKKVKFEESEDEVVEIAFYDDEDPSFFKTMVDTLYAYVYHNPDLLLIANRNHGRFL